MKIRIQNLLITLALLAGIHQAAAQPQTLFETDYGSGTVFQFTPNEVQSAFATNLVEPIGVVFDSNGNLFVSEQGSTIPGVQHQGIIYKFTPAGVQSIFATGLTVPEALVFDSAGNLFESDSGSGNIYEFTNNAGVLSSNYVTFATGLNYPVGLAFDQAGNLFEAAYFEDKINEFTNNGGQLSANYVTFASGLKNPFGLTFDKAGNLFEADSGSGNIYEFTNNAGIISTTPISFISGLDAPYCLAFDNAGNLFTVEETKGNIYEYTSQNTRTLIASGLNHPTFLAFGSSMPSLSIASIGNQSVLFWPTSAMNYVLQSTTNLTSPNWTTASDAMPVIAVTVTNISPARFFRLSIP